MDMSGWTCMDMHGYAWIDMDGRRQMHFPKTTKKKAQRPPRAVELSFWQLLVSNTDGTLMEYKNNMQETSVEY